MVRKPKSSTSKEKTMESSSSRESQEGLVDNPSLASDASTVRGKLNDEDDSLEMVEAKR